MRALGLDIGTTTLSAVVLDVDDGNVVRSFTRPNQAAMTGPAAFNRCQDAGRIWRQAAGLLAEIEQSDGPLASIGITGQMHGILYVDGRGDAVSPLFTWQDESGNQPASDSRTYAQVLSERTGCPMASGFGLTTLFHHLANGQVPPEARQICTIGDYLAMKLTGRRQPLLTPSNAASLGGYLIAENRFNSAVLTGAGISAGFLPEISTGFDRVGVTGTGAIVGAAIGDNQASVIGSVRQLEHAVLVNIGTGSQVSAGIRASRTVNPDPAAEIERRPCLPGTDILVGAPLCGGRAYAALEAFFRAVAAMAGCPDVGHLYDRMDQLLEQTTEEPLRVVPRFCGTRRDPLERGVISQIGLDNFTPGALAKGMVHGIAEELHELCRSMAQITDNQPDQLVGSGNAIRLNPALRRAVEHRFGLKLLIPRHEEEAAFGAALYALVCAGAATLAQAQTLIQYRDSV